MAKRKKLELPIKMYSRIKSDEYGIYSVSYTEDEMTRGLTQGLFQDGDEIGVYLLSSTKTVRAPKAELI